MKVFSPFLNGNTTTSGSFNVPNHPSTASIQNPLTGSLFHDDTDGILKIYTGTQWQVVGEQALLVEGPASADIEYLLVAGGGGGGGHNGGGGGAGGYLSSSLNSVTSGSTFTITLGAPGTGEIDTTGTSASDSTISGLTISTLTAIGGAGGGGGSGGAALNGGSGGGESAGGGAGTGTSGQGNDGGATPGASGGGGGGATTDGGNGAQTSTGPGGNGGAGIQSNIDGNGYYFAGGGGGSGYDNYNAGNGGIGGGGGGSTRTGPSGVGSPGSGGGSAINTGASGVGNGVGGAGGANTGGGGGASNNTTSTGGSGGSGVAIFAYDSGSINAAGGIVGDAGNGRKYNQINSSGTFKVGSTSDFQIVTSNLQLHLDAGNFTSRGTSTWTNLTGNSNFTNTNAALNSNPYYTFTGASNVYMVSDSQITTAGSSNTTIEFWVRSNSSTQDQYADIIDANHSTAAAGSTGLGWVIQQNNLNHNDFYFAYYDGSGFQDAAQFTLTPSAWEHITIVKNGTNVQIYKDGTLDGSYTNTNATMANPTQRLWISAYASGADRNFNGDLGQIRVYSTNLSASEVLQNYNATKTNFI